MMGTKRNRVIKAVLDAQDALKNHQGLLDIAALPERSLMPGAVRSLQENPAIRRMLADIERNQAIVRAAAGPLEEIRRAGVFEQGLLFARELDKQGAQWQVLKHAPACRK